MKYLKDFEGTRIFSLRNRRFQRGTAITLPGIGIFIGEKHVDNTDLLRHEFGHILQKRQKGFFYFWFKIAPVSLKSALHLTRNKHKTHMHTWTEWSANRLSFDYFKKPADWNFEEFPIESFQENN